MFRKDADFEAFERVMVEAHQRQPIRVLSYCVMSNHWHFVVWPEHDGQLTDFFRRLCTRTPCVARFAPDRGVRASLSGTVQEFPGSE